ncbi:MAG: hypothetical protein H0X29_07515 [Parachlamydiaceae bacterium]|nr:hypothetical protein [Parachlamydiaceae bacterium]
MVNMALLSLFKTGYFMKLIYLFLPFILTACSSDSNKGFDNLEEIKKDFITNILTESTLDEGPFQMNYHLRAILFADNVVSLMGDVFVYDHLTHGWIRYEGKWQAGNPLEKHLPITKNFLSSWDSENWISDVQEDHSIAYQKDK